MRFTSSGFAYHLHLTRARIATAHGCARELDSPLAKHLYKQIQVIDEVMKVTSQNKGILKAEALRLLGKYLGKGPAEDAIVADLRSAISRGFPGTPYKTKTRSEVDAAIADVSLFSNDLAKTLAALANRCSERGVTSFDFQGMYQIAERYCGKLDEV